MKAGDLVKVKTKYEGDQLALVVEPHFSSYGREWIVQRVKHHRMTICSPCDLEMVNESRGFGKTTTRLARMEASATWARSKCRPSRCQGSVVWRLRHIFSSYYFTGGAQ